MREGCMHDDIMLTVRCMVKSLPLAVTEASTECHLHVAGAG